MIARNRRGHFKILLIVTLLACGVSQGATLTFNGTFKRRANSDEEQFDIGSHIVYVSPLPGSQYITPSSNIIVRADADLNAGTIQNNLFNVVGSSSGKHSGKIILTDDQRTVLFQPETPFSLGETVNVSMTSPVLSVAEDSVLLHPFSFTISASNLNADKALVSRMGKDITKEEETPAIAEPQPSATQTRNITSENQLKKEPEGFPGDFPSLTVMASDSPSAGYIFISPNMSETTTGQYGNYLIVADNNGNPVFYRNTGAAPGWDFNLQPTGVLTYSYNNNGLHYIMNTSLQVIDSVTCGNGYVNDSHEIRILPNGNIFLIADDYENIDMSKIVPGGDSNATVTENVVQELDQNRNVIFQWRTLDHLNITDAIGQDLTQAQVDPFHCNAIEIDPDGNILLSFRHFSAIMEIDVQTGAIIWQLGGTNNQFSFVNDPIGFSYQHAIRRLPNGDITLFDNGNLYNPAFSRAVEYKLDEVDLTATLVWQYPDNQDTYAQAMGYVQRLTNGNTIIGWGYDEWSAQQLAVTEVEPNGRIALEVAMPNDVFSYRAYRYPFLFITWPTINDTIEGGATTTIRWNSSGVDTVDIDYSADGGNSWINAATNYPADNDSINLSVPTTADSVFKFRITESGELDKGIVFNSDPIHVGDLDGVTPRANPYSFSLSNNYPNPFNPTTIINYEIGSTSIVSLRVYDVLGRQVETLVNDTKAPGKYSVTLDGSRLPSGVYFYRMTAEDYTLTRKAILIK
jgi:hypothetical protein